MDSRRTKTVVHARIGAPGYQVLEDLSVRHGVSLTQALRDLLEDARERMAEEVFGPRLDSMARTLSGIVEQQARHTTRIEAVVALLRSVENGQVEREDQIFQMVTSLLGMHQLSYAYLLAIAETSPRGSDIASSAQTKLQALQGGT
jgi:hypothetical protein